MSWLVVQAALRYACQMSPTKEPYLTQKRPAADTHTYLRVAGKGARSERQRAQGCSVEGELARGCKVRSRVKFGMKNREIVY